MRVNPGRSPCVHRDVPVAVLDIAAAMQLHLGLVARVPLGETEQVSDERLLALVAAGDREQAVGRLYDRFARRIYGFGLHQLGSASLAEELVQETFVRVWQAASRFDPERGSAATFVFTIARRLAVDLWRPRAARPPGGAEAREQAMPNGVDRLLVGLAVREALDGLSPAHREVLELAHGQALTQVEIAERLGIPLGTVKTRTFHALRALRLALREHDVDV